MFGNIVLGKASFLERIPSGLINRGWNIPLWSFIMFFTGKGRWFLRELRPVALM
jgi:hypothetical protein